MRAEDTALNLGPYSGAASATYASATRYPAPTAPAGLGANAVSPTQINLTWSPATDNSAILQYRIERCQGTGCSTYPEIASTTGTSYQDSSRTPSTSYSYRVRAEDTSLNLGPYSATASTQPRAPGHTPSAPGNLTATAGGLTQINLAWSAATDNVGVTGYRLERCQGTGCSRYTQVATPTGTSYSDPGLQAGTSYSYRVRAVDAATNLSPYSAIQHRHHAGATPTPSRRPRRGA